MAEDLVLPEAFENHSTVKIKRGCLVLTRQPLSFVPDSVYNLNAITC